MRRVWQREAVVVVHSPVDVSTFRQTDVSTFRQVDEPGDFYLWCGELVGYKRADLAIAACAALGRKPVVIGDGEDMARLQRQASADVTARSLAERISAPRAATTIHHGIDHGGALTADPATWGRYIKRAQIYANGLCPLRRSRRSLPWKGCLTC